MERVIRPDNLYVYAFVNEDTLKGDVRGVVLDCHGFTDQRRITESHGFARLLGERGVVYIYVYYNPWAWANDRTIEMCDECLDALYDKYGLKKGITPFMVSGHSMGGMTSMIYPLLGTYRPLAVAADCPAGDLRSFYNIHESVRCAFYDSFFHLDLESELTRHNPMERVSDFPDIPYFIMAGEKDCVINEEEQLLPLLEKMNTRNMNVTYSCVPEMGHCSILENESVFSDALREYTDFCLHALGAD